MNEDGAGEWGSVATISKFRRLFGLSNAADSGFRSTNQYLVYEHVSENYCVQNDWASADDSIHVTDGENYTWEVWNTSQL